jgi:hypothetical protein
MVSNVLMPAAAGLAATDHKWGLSQIEYYLGETPTYCRCLEAPLATLRGDKRLVLDSTVLRGRLWHQRLADPV